MSDALRRVRNTLLWCVLAGMVLAIWAFVIEPGWIRYKEYYLSLNTWPSELSGFTVAFITDTHVGSPHINLEKMQDIVDRTNALEPDIILLGGDYVVQGVLGGRPVRFLRRRLRRCSPGFVRGMGYMVFWGTMTGGITPDASAVNSRSRG